MGVPRSQRMRQEFKRETSDILRTMKDPRIGFVSVTDVEVSRDLRHAKIFVSIYGDEEEKMNTLAALTHAQGYVRTALGQRVRLRHTPEILFKLDDSIERGDRINRLLRTVAAEKDGADEADGTPNADEGEADEGEADEQN